MTQNNPEQTADQTILNSIEPCEHGTGADGSPRRAMRVVYGPYTGVVFAFSKFEIDEKQVVEGMYPATYETEIYARPKGFREDESWDQWTSELLQAIVTENIGAYVMEHNAMRPKMRTTPEVQ